jgi:DNA-binding MarR family transcriptional regulator
MTNEISEFNYEMVGRFVALPHAFIDYTEHLTVHTRWLYVALLYYRNTQSGQAFPSYNTLYEKFGLRRKMISKGLKELEKEGWIKKKRRFGRSNTYRFFLPIESEFDDCPF